MSIVPLKVHPPYRISRPEREGTCSIALPEKQKNNRPGLKIHIQIMSMRKVKLINEMNGQMLHSSAAPSSISNTQPKNII